MTTFKRAPVEFCPGISVDGYQASSGEYRVGITGASLVLGYGKQWLSQVLSRDGKTLKALQSVGFTGSQFEGAVQERSAGISGASQVKTISLEDFKTLILYASSQGKKPAIALNRALVGIALEDFFRDAFGQQPLTIDEKRDQFYREYAASISHQEWLEGNASAPDIDYEIGQYAADMLSEFVPTAIYQQWDLDAWAEEHEGDRQ